MAVSKAYLNYALRLQPIYQSEICGYSLAYTDYGFLVALFLSFCVSVLQMQVVLFLLCTITFWTSKCDRDDFMDTAIGA